MDPAVLRADRVAAELDGDATAIPDARRFVLEEIVDAVCGDEDEEALEAEVAKVREAAPLPPVARPFRHAEPILPGDFPVDRPGVFVLRDPARHVVDVALPDTADGKLLDEAFQRSRFESRLFHMNSQRAKHRYHGERQLVPAQLPKPHPSAGRPHENARRAAFAARSPNS
jgi:hypothetical protein